MPPVAGTRQLVPQYFADDGAQAVNVLHFVSIGGSYDQESGDFILQAWADFWTPLMNEGWTIQATAAWRNLAVDPPQDLTATCESENGDGSGDHLPASCAVVCSLQASSGGRSGRGRIYLPGLGEADVAGTYIGPGWQTAADAGLTAFATAVGSETGHVLAVYSRTDGVSRIVESFAFDNVIDSQRRRAQRLAS